MAVQLHAEGVDLEKENDAARFLGIIIECNPNTEFLNDAERSDHTSIGNSWP